MLSVSSPYPLTGVKARETLQSIYKKRSLLFKLFCVHNRLQNNRIFFHTRYWRVHARQEKVSPQSYSPFSVSLQTFRWTFRAFLTVEKYLLFYRLKLIEAHLEASWYCYISRLVTSAGYICSASWFVFLHEKKVKVNRAIRGQFGSTTLSSRKRQYWAVTRNKWQRNPSKSTLNVPCVKSYFHWKKGWWCAENLIWLLHFRAILLYIRVEWLIFGISQLLAFCLN